MKNELYIFRKTQSLSFDKDLNVYIIIDCSGSMDTVITELGKSRLTVAKEQTIKLINYINKVRYTKNLTVNFGICAFTDESWTHDSIKLDMDSGDAVDLVGWVNNLSSDTGGTYYDAPTGKARIFFLSVLDSDFTQTMFFLSDGEATGTSAEDAYNENTDLIDSTGSFASAPVDIYGILIELSDTTDIDYIDNTGGGITIDETDEYAFYNYVRNILSVETAYHFTSADSDITYNNDEYLSIPISRSNIDVKSDVKSTNITVIMSIDNSFARYWLFNDYDEFLSFELIEYDGITASTLWIGQLGAIKAESDKLYLIFELEYTSLSRIGLRRVYQRLCSHVLYGQGCRLKKSVVLTTGIITAINNNVLTVPVAAGESDHYFTYGIIEDTNGNTRYITNHEGSLITINKPSQAFQDEFDSEGDVDIKLYPGCDKTTTTCLTKFDNLDNYGGFPYIPTDENPFKKFYLF